MKTIVRLSLAVLALGVMADVASAQLLGLPAYNYVPATAGVTVSGRLGRGLNNAAGKGDGQFASALNPKPANFTDPAFQAARTDAQLTSSITDGKSPMPAFGQQLSPAEIKALVAYIRQMAKK